MDRLAGEGAGVGRPDPAGEALDTGAVTVDDDDELAALPLTALALPLPAPLLVVLVPAPLLAVLVIEAVDAVIVVDELDNVDTVVIGLPLFRLLIAEASPEFSPLLLFSYNRANKHN